MKEYVLGTDEAEYRRLGLQHRLWGWHAHRAWERARIMPGVGVLDIGCGPGWAGMDIAGLVGPTGSVFGVDASQRFVDAFNGVADATGTKWARAVVGDVDQLIEVAGGEGPFDVAWARWVLCFLPSPDRVVQQVAELLNPGGRFVVQDYFNYRGMRLAPTSAIFEKVIDAIGQSWIDSGGNPDVMGQIEAPLRNSGFRIVQTDVIQRIARPGEQMWWWPTVFWESFLPRVVASGHLSESDHQEFLGVWAEASANPDAFMQLPPVYEVVAEKV